MSLMALLVVIAICGVFCYPVVLLRKAIGLPEMPYDPLFIFGAIIVGVAFAYLLGALMTREK